MTQNEWQEKWQPIVDELRPNLLNYLSWRHPEIKNPESGRLFTCLNPGHRDSKPSMQLLKQSNNTRVYCYGCGASYDLIDLIGIDDGITDTVEKVKRACEIYHVPLPEQESKANQKHNKTERKRGDSMTKSERASAAPAGQAEADKEADFTEFFLQAHEHLSETDYHRGLSRETLDRFNVGYVESWKGPKTPEWVEPSPRLIIPTSAHSYLARDTRPNLTGNAADYTKQKVGKVHFLNAEALWTAQEPVFIVEGEIDAMSVCDVGAEAVALGSTSMVKRFLSLLEERPPLQPLIVALDNDAGENQAGQRAALELKEGLEALGLPCYLFNIAGDLKDANDALQADRNAFAMRVFDVVTQVGNLEEQKKEAAIDELRKESVKNHIADFLENIKERKQAPCYTTGLEGLNKILDGGLYEGLYIVGAISSLGKTTFCLQMADAIAAAGHDVLFFSLEVSRNELMAKSVSRNTLLANTEELASTAHAMTTRDILSGRKHTRNKATGEYTVREYDDTEKYILQSALARYEKYADHIYITEGVGTVGIEDIKEKVRRHKETTGKAPVVMIDYLQIIAPFDIKATDKQNTDRAVLELKRLSRDYHIPVVGISSFNRDNYKEPVSMASFKESGAIEYSSDVLIGLQYTGMDYNDDEKDDNAETDKARKQRIRQIFRAMEAASREGRPQKIQIKVLKNRNGIKGDAQAEFLPAFNYYRKPTRDAEQVKGAVNNGGWKATTSNYGR